MRITNLRMTKPVAILWGILALWFALGCATPSLPNPSPSRPGATSPPVTVNPAPGHSQANPAPMGTTVSPALGWEVTVTGAEVNGDATVLATNALEKPAAGKQFVLVSMTVANLSNTPAPVSMNVLVTLLPTSGVAIPAGRCLANATDAIEPTAQMQPGATRTGRLCFEVPIADVPGAVVLAEPTFTVDKAKDQHFLAFQ